MKYRYSTGLPRGIWMCSFVNQIGCLSGVVSSCTARFLSHSPASRGPTLVAWHRPTLPCYNAVDIPKDWQFPSTYTTSPMRVFAFTSNRTLSRVDTTSQAPLCLHTHPGGMLPRQLHSAS